jgi:hypothetical protein
MLGDGSPLFRADIAAVERRSAAALEQASAAVGRLDARTSATSGARAWQLRAAWTGYAAALQLQGHEIDEIDVFSWGCALPSPAGHGSRRSTIPSKASPDGRPSSPETPGATGARTLGARVEPDPSYAGPRLIRALEALRQISIAEKSKCSIRTAAVQRIGMGPESAA